MRESSYNFSRQYTQKPKHFRGGEKKVMRKSLSLLLAVALVFAMFAPLALADDVTLTTEQKFEALKQEGIFSGVLKADGSTDAELDANMTRAQFGIVIQKLLRLTDVNPATPTFKDVPASHWAYNAVEASVLAGILQGRGNGIYDPNADVSIQELAIVLVNAVGLSVDDSVTAVPGAAPWAAKYVQAAVAAGLIPAQASYTQAATRAQLVDASYVANEAVQGSLISVQEVKVISSKEISVTFSDGVTKSFAVDPALVSGVATQVSFEYNGKTYTHTVTLKELAVSAKVVGAKKVDLVFNQAIDTSKATIAVKNNNNTVNIKTTTFSDDKTTAKLEFANNLAKADYTVTVSGLTEKALTAKFSIEDEKVVKIEFSSDKAPLVRDSGNKKLNVGYKVFNQYNEDISSTTSLNPSTSKGTVPSTVSGGTLEITAPASASEFVINEEVFVSLLHSSGTFASGTLKVAPVAQVAEINIVKLDGPEDKETKVGETASDFNLVLELKDQYGNTITSATDVAKDVLVTVSNPNVANVNGGSATPKFDKVDDDIILKLAATAATFENAGTSKITILSRTSGKMASIDVEVKQSNQIDTFTLSAPEIAVAGETVSIPYTAVDQYGKNVDHPVKSDLASLTTNGWGSIDFSKDVVKNKTNLELNLSGMTDAGTVIITAITKTNKVVQLNVNVVAPKVATVVAGTKELNTLLLGDTKAVTVADNVIIKDQYNRDMDLPAGYGVKVEVSGDAITSSNKSINTTFTANKKGSSTITLTLTKNGEDVANSSYSFSLKVVEKADISSYKATVTGIVYGNVTASADPDYGKDLKVTGLLADGKEVTIPNGKGHYSVVFPAASNGLSHTAGKIQAVSYDFDEDNKEYEVPVIVAVQGAKATDTLTVTVKVSNKAPEIATLALKDENTAKNAKKEDEGLVSSSASNLNSDTKVLALANSIVEAKDQYGVVKSPSFIASGVFINNIADDKGNSKSDIEDVASGDTFNVTAITGNGKIITFKVVAK